MHLLCTCTCTEGASAHETLRRRCKKWGTYRFFNPYGKNTAPIKLSEKEINCYVNQNYVLFNHLTVYENIAFGLDIRRVNSSYIQTKVKQLLELIELESFSKRYPSQLSGGQRQRVALARALAIEPTFLLLDEPFGALDMRVRKELRDWLRRLHEQVAVTTLFVTHDYSEAKEIAQEIIVFEKGRVEQLGSPQDLFLGDN